MYIVLDIVKEMFLILILIPIILLGYIFPLTKINKNSSSNKQIVFVCGWFNNNLLYFFLKKHLEKQGYQVHMTNFGLLTGDITKYSQRLADFFDEQRLERTVLIGASLGGVIGLYFLQELNGWKKIDKFIGICSPFAGFPVARMFSFLKAGRQISPNSKFLKSLFSKKIMNEEKILCISSKYDNIVPKSSATIMGARNEVLKIFGHTNLLAFSSQVYKLITDYLSL